MSVHLPAGVKRFPALSVLTLLWAQALGGEHGASINVAALCIRDPLP